MPLLPVPARDQPEGQSLDDEPRVEIDDMECGDSSESEAEDCQVGLPSPGASVSKRTLGVRSVMGKITKSFYTEAAGGTPRSRAGRARSLYSSDMSDSDSEHEDFEGKGSCCSCREERCCSGDTLAHWCYVFVFLLFLIVFPFYIKWLHDGPVPQRFWNQEFAKFPLLSDWPFVQNRTIQSLNVNMSHIPTTWSGCNHNCGSNPRAASMNFNVDVKLEAPSFKHTAYPVLIASNDWDNWFVVGDRSHAKPQPYFAGQSSFTGIAYRQVTSQCSRPPNLISNGPVNTVEHLAYNSAPTYLLVCVTWDVDKVSRHRLSKNISGAHLGDFCDAVGGACGWACGSSPSDASDLPGCSNSALDVDKVKGLVAGQAAGTSATFDGTVSVRSCAPETDSNSCVASDLPLSRWNCHKCRNTTEVDGGAPVGPNATTPPKEKLTVEYDSFPPMEILLQDANIKETPGKAIQPYVFVLTSPVAKNGKGPEGMQPGGVWEKLYDLDIFPGPKPTTQVLREEADTRPTASPFPTYDVNRNAMHLTEANKVTMEPESCFGERGPLYLVACAVNGSTHKDYFEFKAGQAVAPPPFNDRCVAVSGRCARACMEQQTPMDFCVDGQIEQHLLDGSSQDVETRTNSGFVAVHLFIIVLLVGFAAKMLAYGPGIFSPYKAAKFYKPAMTDSLKYISACTPSAGETKACVLRNLVGSLSARPNDCRCSYHVVYSDEGHRHPQKIMFRVLASILTKIPGTSYKKKDDTHSRDALSSNEFNIKCFFRQWVQDTNKFILVDCNTADMAKELKELPEDSSEAKKLNTKIDALCGIKALRGMQELKSWPKAADSLEIHELTEVLVQLRKELLVGEKKFDGTGHGASDNPKALQFDDCEDYTWPSVAARTSPAQVPLFTLHYVGRAKPDENERIIKVQHVARGAWCYKLPKAEEKRNGKSWLDWRKSSMEYTCGEQFLKASKFLVPVRTSRGKAGGLNFAENYLFDYCRKQETSHQILDPVRYKYALFGISDARHQFQPDFFSETVPYFFRRDDQLNSKVAFTQCPQYFQEMPDDADYLDTNNSQFFRLGCMLRNCCGGVSSCGTNGTWLVRDRRSGTRGLDCVWDMNSEEQKKQGFTQILEWRFFHESCKVEDTASSLDRVVKGKCSQYINMRLSYGMAKEPTDYLAAVQRWAEGGVVLSLQTFFGREQGVYQIWAALLIWLAFIASLLMLVYGVGLRPFFSWFFGLFTGDDTIVNYAQRGIQQLVGLFVVEFGMQPEWAEDYENMIFDLMLWLVGLTIACWFLWFITKISYYVHHTTCCGRRKQWNRTRFPTSLAQWGRLMITVNNLTYFLWFWTAFFWVGFNYYSVFAEKKYDFDTDTMLALSWILNILNWSLVISSTFRYKIGESMVSNEVFSLTLTNIWRTTQMFYITAPLTLFSIIVGTLDFMRNRTFGEDISYWVGGDRGAISKMIVQYWTLLLITLTMLVWLSLFAGWLPNTSSSYAALVVVTFIGCDVLLPCAYLWLGSKPEKIPPPFNEAENPPTGIFAQLQRAIRRCFQKLFCMAWHRNNLRAMVFSKMTTGILKWVAPLQQVVQPFLIMFLPELGINVAIGIIVAGRN